MQTWFSLYKHCMSIKVNCKPHVKKYYPVTTGFDCGQPGLLGDGYAGCFWANPGHSHSREGVHRPDLPRHFHLLSGSKQSAWEWGRKRKAWEQGGYWRRQARWPWRGSSQAEGAWTWNQKPNCQLEAILPSGAISLSWLPLLRWLAPSPQSPASNTAWGRWRNSDAVWADTCHCMFVKTHRIGTSLVVQWIRICLQAGESASIPGPGRSHIPRGNWGCVPQLLSPRSATREATTMRSPGITARE